MKKNHLKSSNILDAENAKCGERYVRRNGKAQAQRDAMRSVWQEISRINRRGLN